MTKNPSAPTKSGLKNSNLSPKEGHTVKIGEASKVLGLHIDTLRRWERNGKITPVRTPGGTRLYSLDELSSLIPKVPDNSSKPSTKQLPLKNPHRIDREDIYVHIYNKGIEKRTIFNDKEDYEAFLGFLKDYLTAPKDPDSIKRVFKVRGRIFRGTPHQPNNYFNKVELIAFCLMPDHFHLLLHQVAKGSLENFIRSLCTRYSMYFNKKHRHTGALFEGPYKSVLVKDESRLLDLTRYLHQAGDYSSYPEYLGTRVTSWVKPKDSSKILASTDYNKELIQDINFDSQSQHLEGRGLSRKVENPSETATKPPEEIYSNSYLKPHQRIPELLAAGVIFLLLFAIGLTNIQISTAKGSQPLAKHSQPLPAHAVLGATKEATSNAVSKAPIDIVKPKIILTIKVDDGSSFVNIRQKPTASSEKIGKTKNGDTFEFVSLNSGWYEVKLTDGSIGFISAAYVEKGETGH